MYIHPIRHDETTVKHARHQPRDHARGRCKFPVKQVLVVRLRELTKLLHHRYSLGLDTDDADLILLPIARLLFRIHADKGKIASDRNLTRELLGWCWTHTPLIDSDTVTNIAIEAMARPELENKTALGIRVRLTTAERDALHIGTIRPYDQSPAQFERSRRDKRRANNRAIQAAKRREAGAVPRQQYLAQSLSRTRPWEAEGISRSTWERRRAKGTVTQVRHPPSFLLEGDTLASPSSPAAAQQLRQGEGGHPLRARRPQGRGCLAEPQQVKTGLVEG